MEVLEKAYNTLILSLSDKVLREVVRTTTAAEVWLQLESLYMTKTVSSRIYIKQRLFKFRMTEGKDLQTHLDDYVKILLDLENIGEK